VNEVCTLNKDIFISTDTKRVKKKVIKYSNVRSRRSIKLKSK